MFETLQNLPIVATRTGGGTCTVNGQFTNIRLGYTRNNGRSIIFAIPVAIPAGSEVKLLCDDGFAFVGRGQAFFRYLSVVAISSDGRIAVGHGLPPPILSEASLEAAALPKQIITAPLTGGSLNETLSLFNFGYNRFGHPGIYVLSGHERIYDDERIKQLRITFENIQSRPSKCTAYNRYYDIDNMQVPGTYVQAEDARPDLYYSFNFPASTEASKLARPVTIVHCETNGSINNWFKSYMNVWRVNQADSYATPSQQITESIPLAKSLSVSLATFAPTLLPDPNATYASFTLSLNELELDVPAGTALIISELFEPLYIAPTKVGGGDGCTLNGKPYSYAFADLANGGRGIKFILPTLPSRYSVTIACDQSVGWIDHYQAIGKRRLAFVAQARIGSRVDYVTTIINP